MSEIIPIPFPESRIILAVEEHLNKTFFKTPHTIVSVEKGVGGVGYIVSVEPIVRDKKAGRPRARRGLARSVLANGESVHTEDAQS